MNYIPDELLNALQDGGLRRSRSTWLIGELALVAREHAVNNGVPAEKCWSDVGGIVGMASRTVREFAALAERFPAAMRAEIDPAQLLAADHYRAAMRCPEPENALRWAVQHVGQTGKPPSVDMMLAMIMQPAASVFGVPEPAERDLPHAMFVYRLREVAKIMAGAPISDDVRQLLEDAISQALSELEEVKA